MRNNKQKKTIKKLLSVVLTASIITTSFASVAQASAQTIEGAPNKVVTNTKTTENQAVKPNKEFVIKNKDDFSKFMRTSEYWDNNYKITLACDIDMQHETFESIKEFSGVFDGCEHTVSNLRLSNNLDEDRKNGKSEIAFIKTLNSQAEFKNIQFDNYDILFYCSVVDHSSNSIRDNNAVLIFYNYGNISEVKIGDGTISSCNPFGVVAKGKGNRYGFVYYNSGKIINCSTKLSSLYNNHGGSSLENIGGFCGYNDEKGEIISCESTGNVKSYSESVSVNCGGFVGKNVGKILNCTSDGKVEAKINTANKSAAVGWVPIAGQILATLFTLDAGVGNIGGFCGVNEGEIISSTAANSAKACAKTDKNIWCGGFVGNNEKGKIDGCTATGEAIGEEYVGGFAGVNKSDINNCHAYGKATAKTRTHTTRAGGFVGENEKGEIIDCTAEGGAESKSDLGQAKTGGFVGVNKASIINSKAYTKGKYEDGKDKKVYLSSGIGRTDNGCGGFVGKNDKCGNINSCYAECTVETSRKNKGGGFVGEAKNNSIIKNSNHKSIVIIKKGKTKEAKFCQKRDKKAVIKNYNDNMKK